MARGSGLGARGVRLKAVWPRAQSPEPGASQGFRVDLANHQSDRIPLTWLKRVAARVVRALRITGRGRLSIAFVDAPTMRRLNRTFLQHRGLTDVLTFRYAEEGVRCQVSGVRAGRTRHPTPVARHLTLGEILVSPTFARQYAQEHGVSYEEELARYVVHGLLHWVGHDDRTPRQRRRMRQMEDQLLMTCGIPAEAANRRIGVR